MHEYLIFVYKITFLYMSFIITEKYIKEIILYIFAFELIKENYFK